jgi:hypothetical protein
LALKKISVTRKREEKKRRKVHMAGLGSIGHILRVTFKDFFEEPSVSRTEEHGAEQSSTSHQLHEQQQGMTICLLPSISHLDTMRFYFLHA